MHPYSDAAQRRDISVGHVIFLLRPAGEGQGATLFLVQAVHFYDFAVGGEDVAHGTVDGLPLVVAQVVVAEVGVEEVGLNTFQ